MFSAAANGLAGFWPISILSALLMYSTKQRRGDRQEDVLNFLPLPKSPERKHALGEEHQEVNLCSAQMG